ncbi:MAG: IPTL-CTERM sorting domain-containing protein [Comamonadaceae bacterium]|nr:IPTL-CTERM sorting domain-containing protein [Comamonadaceae bacterium]
MIVLCSPIRGTARAVALLFVLGATASGAHAAPACSVTDAITSPAGCELTTVWSGSGEFEPAIVSVTSGGQYSHAPAGLYIYNSNNIAPGGNSGTRGIHVDGESSANVASRADIAGYVPITIHVTNVANPDDNDGVYVGDGAQVQLRQGLNVITTTTGNPAYQARAVTVNGVGALAGSHASLTVTGSLEADTSGAPSTVQSIRVADRGQVQAQGGGAVASARIGIHAYDAGVFESTSATATMSVTAGTHAVVVEGAYDLTKPVARVALGKGNLNAMASAVVLTSNVASMATGAAFTQSGGSITSSQGSAFVFASGSGPTNVWLENTSVQSNGALGPGPDGYAAGLVAYSMAELATLTAVKSHLIGPMGTDGPGRLWLNLSDTQWNTGGDPSTANSNWLTGISGSGTIVMPDVKDRITLTGAPGGFLGETGCGAAALTLAVPAGQAAPPTSPHAVMVCQHAVSYPTMVLEGGSVALGGYNYTLETVVAEGRAVYQLVRRGPVGSNQINSVPALSTWAMLLMSGLLALAGLRRRRR